MCTTRPIPCPSYQGSIGPPTLRRRTLCQKEKKEEKGEGYFEGHGHIPIWPLKQRRRRKQDHCNLCVHIVCGPRGCTALVFITESHHHISTNTLSPHSSSLSPLKKEGPYAFNSSQDLEKRPWRSPLHLHQTNSWGQKLFSRKFTRTLYLWKGLLRCGDKNATQLVSRAILYGGSQMVESQFSVTQICLKP